MKRAIITSLLIGVMAHNSLVIAHPLFDKEGRNATRIYAVGTKMPTKEDGKVTNISSWYSRGGKTGLLYEVDINGDYKRDIRIAYMRCGNIELKNPFGAFYFPSSQLMFDNGKGNKKSMDRIIDEVRDFEYDEPTYIAIEEGALNCPKRVFQEAI
jgi:hypothetical protein|tara:strand:- start:189 stop:653 length:465 start_codon:yes stop_codon:yes gene_type:complete